MLCVCVYIYIYIYNETKQQNKAEQIPLARSQRNMLVADLDGVRRFVAREEHEPSAREALRGNSPNNDINE